VVACADNFHIDLESTPSVVSASAPTFENEIRSADSQGLLGGRRLREQAKERKAWKCCVKGRVVVKGDGIALKEGSENKCIVSSGKDE